MVQMGSLVIVEISRARFPFEQMPSQLEHVVGVARFAGVARKTVIQLVGLAKVLVVAIPPNCVSVVMNNSFPKELCCLRVGLIGRNLR